MIGIVVVRDGRLGFGAAQVDEVADELWLIGSGVDRIASSPRADARRVEAGQFAPSAWTEWIQSQIGTSSVVFAGSPDGRDLAGRLGERLDRPVYSGCVQVTEQSVVSPRYGGSTTVIAHPAGPFVATVQPRSGPLEGATPTSIVEKVLVDAGNDVRTESMHEPDLATLHLSDAHRIVAGGAGLGREEEFAALAQLSESLGAALGATRVVTDRGWLPYRRQIGTTGATVSPELYVAFGISGAVQHTSGLGSPSHIISVNTDGACPMSQMADVAIVADAAATVHALNTLLGSTT